MSWVDSSYVGANLKQSYITCNKIIKNFVFFAEISFQKYPKCLFAFKILTQKCDDGDLSFWRLLACFRGVFAVFVGVVGEGR